MQRINPNLVQDFLTIEIEIPNTGLCFTVVLREWSSTVTWWLLWVLLQ